MIDTLRRTQSSMVTGGLSPLDDSGWGELCRHYILHCAVACVLWRCMTYRLATFVGPYTQYSWGSQFYNSPGNRGHFKYLHPTWFPRGTEAISNICTLHGSPGKQRLFHLHPTQFHPAECSVLFSKQRTIQLLFLIT